MSVTETLLIFVGIPVAVVLVIAGLSYAAGSATAAAAPSATGPAGRFDFTPVWFLGRPEQLADSAGTALAAGAQAPALTSHKLAAGRRRGAGRWNRRRK